jgi:bifunctional pyridoxal-dependent enzyme with beta-cystathionase and maltose regulon repressor activities
LQGSRDVLEKVQEECEGEGVNVVCSEVHMSVMVEDLFLYVHRYISHAVLCNMTKMSALKTDSISLLCIAPIKIIGLCSGHYVEY